MALCQGNASVTGGFSSHKAPVINCFDVFFVNNSTKLSNKHWSGRWFETPWRSYNLNVNSNNHKQDNLSHYMNHPRKLSCFQYVRLIPLG